MVSAAFLFAAVALVQPCPGGAYTEEPEPFRNPGQGWSVVPGNWDKATNCVNVGVVYDRIAWTDLEPEEGRYDFSIIDDQIKFAVQRGVPYHFRVRCASKVSNNESDTPQWVYEKGCRYFTFDHARPWRRLKDGTRVPAGKLRCPYFDDPVFLESHARFVRALAARYDGDPRIFAIDIGSYGHFGEWHMSAFGIPKQKLEADVASRRRIADMYLANFKKTRLIFLTGDETTLAHALGGDSLHPRTGLRRDGIGLPGYAEMWAGSKRYSCVPDMGEVWKWQPLCFEWGGISRNIYEGKATTPNGKRMPKPEEMPGNFDWIRAKHGTTINSSPFAPWFVRSDDVATLEAMRRCDLYCGARLVPLVCTHARCGGDLSIDLLLVNRGTSRIYMPYVLQAVVRRASGDEIGAVSLAADPGTWLPGEHRVRETVKLPGPVPADARLSLRLRHVPGVFPDFRFAAKELNGAGELCLDAECGTAAAAGAAPLPAYTNFSPRVPARTGGTSPRLFLNAGNLPALRKRCAPGGDFAAVLDSWRKEAKAAVGADIPPEPAWLPDGKDARRRAFTKGFVTIRPPTAMMQKCALVYVLGGDGDMGAEARRRVLHYFGWDPKGPSNTFHNDEAAMSVMRNGVRAYDWTRALYSPAERAAVEACAVERSRQIYELLQRSKYHEDTRNSHLGRQIGFLAEACVALMPEHPEMKPWFDYVIGIYRTAYPAWGTEDGGWSQGPHYWNAYMEFGLDSLVAVRIGTGIDIFRERPFFRQTPWYFAYQCPWRSPVSPFGDGWQNMEQPTGTMRSFAVLLKSPELLWLANRRQARPGSVRDLVLDPKSAGLEPKKPENLPQTRCFPGEGLVMSHSDLLVVTNDVAFYFRSSPYGSISHGHADQNSFVICGYGEPLAIASGCYNYFGSPHHVGWMRQTRAKCAITYDGGKGQPFATESKGRISRFATDGIDASFSGDASAAYGTAVSTALREVVRIGAEVFVIRDTLVAPEPHGFEFNLHAMDEMRVDERARKVVTVRPNAVLETTFLSPVRLSFSQTDRFDPPPKWAQSKTRPMPNQWHLAAAAPSASEMVFVTVLAVRRAGAPSPVASAKLVDGVRAVELTLLDGAVRTAVFEGPAPASP